jgi:hypothetical protein
MREAFEPIEQHFSGTVEELAHFLYDYDLLRYALRPPGSKGDYLVLAPVAALSYFYVLKRISKQGKELTKNWQGEGTWALSQMTMDPPRARFICRPLTKACKKVALAIAREIESGGYKPGALQVRRGAAARAGSRKPLRPKQGRGPQAKTLHALQQLREMRSEALRNHRPIPTKKAAMSAAGITDKTWLKYDPGLCAGWSDKDFESENPE